MSTTLEVCPGTEHIPTFRQVTELADRHLQTFLRAQNLACKVSFSVQMLDARSNERVHLNLDGAATWDEDQYAWFAITEVGGGTDAYLRPLTMLDRGDSLVEEFTARSLDASWQESIQRALRIGHYWTFRCSAGQPAPIRVGYGMLACALAELTNGFVYTDDGAWDYRRFPARPTDMLTWYCVPNLTVDEEFRTWATKLLTCLPRELREGGYLGDSPANARFWEVTPIDRAEALLHLASDDPGQIGETLIRLSYFDTDWRWVQECCLAAVSHRSADVRAAAAISLGHLARIHGTLDLDRVEPALRGLRYDPVTTVAGNAEAALDDIACFIKPK